MLSIFGELSLASQACDVTAGIRLCDGETNALFSTEESRSNAFDQFWLRELEHWRPSDTVAADKVPDKTSAAGPRQFIGEDHLMEVIPLLWRYTGDSLVGVLCRIMDAQEACKVSTFTHLLVDFVGHLLCLVPLGNVGHDLVFNPCSYFLAQGYVSLVVIGAVVGLIPRRVRVGNEIAV